MLAAEHGCEFIYFEIHCSRIAELIHVPLKLSQTFVLSFFNLRLYTSIHKCCFFTIPVDFEFGRTFWMVSIFHILILIRDFEWQISFNLGLNFKRLIVSRFMKDIYINLNYYKRNKTWGAKRPKFCSFHTISKFCKYLL